MPLFEDTAEDEIRRLRRIIAKLEKAKGIRIVTVEMVPRYPNDMDPSLGTPPRENGSGHLFYITAPTTASEEVFGLAMSEMIQKAFRVIGANVRQDVVAGDHIAPPNIDEEQLNKNLHQLAGDGTFPMEIFDGLVDSFLARCDVEQGEKRPDTDCYLSKDAFGRWIVVNANDKTLAWSGSRWVAHERGVPAGGVQVSNFESAEEAWSYARSAGLTPIRLLSLDASESAQ